MLARSVTLNLAGSVGSMLVGFVGSILLARGLGPADRGLLALLLSLSTVALTLTAMGLPMAVLYYASLPDRSTPRIFGTTLAYAGVLAVVLVPATGVGRHLLAQAFTHGRGGWAWVLAAALVPITFLDWTMHNQILGQLRFTLFNVLGVLGKLATLAAIVVLIQGFHVGVAGGLIATAAASLVMIGGCLPSLARRGLPVFDRALLSRFLAYGARVQVGAIFSAVNYRLDVIILQFFRPLSEVGYYAVAQIIAELVTVLAGAFQSSVIPLVASSGVDSRERTTILSLRHHAILAAIGCIANAGFGTLVILYAYGTAYHAAVVPMLVILPGIWFLGTGSVVTSDLRGRGRPGAASVVSGVAVVVTVALDLLLVPPFGVVGAAVASLVAYTVFGIVALVTLSRITAIPVRVLIVPTRADLAAYPVATRRIARTIRGLA